MPPRKANPSAIARPGHTIPLARAAAMGTPAGKVFQRGVTCRAHAATAAAQTSAASAAVLLWAITSMTLTQRVER